MSTRNETSGLGDRVLLITGGARRVGAQIARTLHGAGAKVLLNYRTSEAAAKALAAELNQLRAGSAAIHGADLHAADAPAALVAATLREFGRIDILINNAAIRPHKPFTDLTAQDWETVRGIVLDGPLFLTQAVIGSMVENRYGRILFFTGEGAFIGGNGRAHVSAAKMALVGFARGLASEFAPHNIRVNVVSPGSIDTQRANPEWYQGRTPSAAGIPLGRQGKVDEIAATCLFLVSDDGGFITGQTIHVNGGSAYY
jgi:3-oxoacyl-[acyl-carrier protein] reductase